MSTRGQTRSSFGPACEIERPGGSNLVPVNRLA
jgi:hypothetical protein